MSDDPADSAFLLSDARGVPLIVVAAALVDPAGRVLVQRRAAGVHRGLWEFPGGKVESGETIENALCRELAEELAVHVGPAALIPAGFSHGNAGGRDLLLLLYLVRDWTGEPRPLAAEALAWHVPRDLAALPMPPADRPLVAALRRMI